MGFVSLVPIYLTSRLDLIDPLRLTLERAFSRPVRVRPPWFDPEHAFSMARGQYDSTRLLAALLDEPPDQGEKVIAIAGVDLFVPVLTYVFGEAQLGGRAAVASLHRLDDEVYGLPPNRELLGQRLAKEAIHELGHTFGLLHCRDSRCVMRPSTVVEEIDLKTGEFCARCRTAVRPRPFS